MDPITVGVLGCALLLVLLLMGMPIAFMMMFVGFLGIWYLTSMSAALPIVARTLYGVTRITRTRSSRCSSSWGSFAGAAGITGSCT